MHPQIGNIQRCILIAVHVICIVTLVQCSPSNLIDTSSESTTNGNFHVISTSASIETNVSNVTNEVAESITDDLRPVDNENYVNEQKSITIRLEDLHDFLKEFMKDNAKDQENSLEQQSGDARAFITDILFNEKFIRRVKKFTEKYIFNVGSASSSLDSIVPSAGRVFFFKGKNHHN